MIRTEEEPLYSSQKDEERPQIGQRIIPEPDEIGILIKRPVIKSDVKEIDPALVDPDDSTQPEPVTEPVIKATAKIKKTSIIDRIVLTIYQLLY